MKLRPMNDLVLVKLDPLAEVSKGGIALIADNTVSSVRTATVLSVGPGRWEGKHRHRVGVEEGERVVFLRWHLEHQSGKAIANFLSEVGDDLGLIKAADILFAFPAGQNVEVSQ